MYACIHMHCTYSCIAFIHAPTHISTTTASSYTRPSHSAFVHMHIDFGMNMYTYVSSRAVPVHMHACTCVHMHVHTYLPHTWLWIRISPCCVPIHAFMHMYMCMHVCFSLCLFLSLSACAHIKVCNQFRLIV